MTPDEARAFLEAELDKVTTGFRHATQFVDELSQLMRIPYRPPQWQPLQEAWQGGARIRAAFLALAEENQRLRKEP